MQFVVIRKFTSDDYQAIVDVGNAVFPEYPESSEEWRHRDETRPSNLHWSRWVAQVDGKVVGYSHYQQNFPIYHPRKFGIDALVLPDFQGLGIGKALYEAMRDGLAPLDPIGLRTHARETEARAIRFLRERGFNEVQREQESLLEMSGWCPDNWGQAVRRVEQTGICLLSYNNLIAVASSAADLHANGRTELGNYAGHSSVRAARANAAHRVHQAFRAT